MSVKMLEGGGVDDSCWLVSWGSLDNVV